MKIFTMSATITIRSLRNLSSIDFKDLIPLKDTICIFDAVVF